MKIESFLDILEDRQLVPTNVVAKLREKISQSQRKYTAKSVLKYLVKKDLVTKVQAKQLLETTLTVSSHAESSILGMVPLPKMPAEQEPPSESSSIFSDELVVPKIVGDGEDDDVPTLAPVEEDQPEIVEEGLSQATQNAISTVDLPSSEYPGTPADSFLASSSSIDAPQDDLFDETTDQEPQASRQRSKKKRQKGKKANEWDSPLLLLGGGALVLMVVVGGALVYLLNREDADAILAAASEYFDGGSYTQAINQYERFVESNPRHPEFSQAKVRLGMARLWKVVEGNSNFPASLETAQQVLDNIQDEEQFNLAQEDLASLLPRIAEGLANLAEKEVNLEKVQQHVEQSNTALSLYLNTKFVPKGFRNEALLESVKETLRRVEQNRKQRAALAQAVISIDQAIEQHDTAAAYAIHKALLKDFSTLRSEPSLAAKVAEISAAEHAGIQFIDESIAAQTTPQRSSIVASLALAERRGKPVAQAEGLVTVRVDGALYTLSVSDGSLQWRKFIGIAPSLHPVLLPGGDILAVDSTRNELQRLVGKTGKLVWRQTFDAPIMRPVLLDERLLVAEQSGKLYVLNAASGERTGYVQFSQPASAPPTVDRQGQHVYLVGSHSSVYTLSAADFSCQGVHYLGHSHSSVLTSAKAVLNKLIVAENAGARTSRLHVLLVGPDGVIATEVSTHRLEGLVTTPVLGSSRRVLAITNAGQATVFEVGGGDDSSSFTPLATRDAQSGSAVTRYGAIHQGHLWLAGTGLNKLAITPTGNRLPLIDLDRNYGDAIFDSPLLVVGNLLLHLRRPRSEAGVILAAMDTTTGKETWETALAVPLAGSPAVDMQSARMIAATTSGAFFSLDRQAMSQRIQDSAQRHSTLSRNTPPLTQAVDLGKGRLVVGEVGANLLLHYDPDALRQGLQKIRLVSPLGTQLLAWNGGLIVPTTLGQVFLFDAETAQSEVAPFQPAISPGATYHWLCPASFGEGEDSRLLLSDGNNKLYLIRQADQPEPRLVADAEVDIEGSPLNTPLVVFASRVCAGTEDSRLATFALPSLESAEPVALGGNVVWGPHAAGKQLLLATDTDELVCLDEAFQTIWRQPLAHGSLIGVPIQVEGDCLVLSSSRLSRIGLQDGIESAHIALSEPVVAGPVSFGKRLVLSSHDGTLLIVNRP